MPDTGAVPACRLLPSVIADGAWQMAADEVMLESAASDVASIRFYRWSVPTLSLGYFQPQAIRLLDPRLAKLAYVRRPSGGAALVHHHELTYALALPSGSPWQRRGDNWIERMHRVVVAALGDLGAEASSVASGDRRKLGETLCFLDQTPGDLVAQGHKVVGSARRKHKSAVLQHGGILLAKSEFTPELLGLQELFGLSSERFHELESGIIRALSAETGWQFEAGDWSESEVARRTDLIRHKYSTDAWNAKR